MRDNLPEIPPEANTELTIFDVWLQRFITYAGLPTSILFLLTNYTYLALICFAWLATAIGYAFVKNLRKQANLELGIVRTKESPNINAKPTEKEKQEVKQLPLESQAKRQFKIDRLKELISQRENLFVNGYAPVSKVQRFNMGYIPRV